MLFLFFNLTSLGVSLFDKSKGNTLTLWKRNGVGLTVTDDEDVSDSGRESVSSNIFDVSDIESTWMSLDGGEGTDSTDIVSTGKHNSGVVGELDDLLNGTGGKVNLDGIVDADVWMWESDGSSIVGGDVWDLGFTDLLGGNSAEFEGSLFGIDSVWLESSSGIEEHSEVLIALGNGDDIHGSEWESWVSSDFTVNNDVSGTLGLGAGFDDLSGFISVKSILQSLLKENVKRNALSSLVWTSGWLGGIDSSEFTKVPGFWCVDSLHRFSLSFVSHVDLNLLRYKNIND